MNLVLLIPFRLLEGLFAIGIAGTVIVLCIATVEDMKLFFEKDKPSPVHVIAGVYFAKLKGWPEGQPRKL
jgi:hypothetical protein